MRTILTLNLEAVLSIVSITVSSLLSIIGITVALASWILTNKRNNKLREKQQEIDVKWVNYQKEIFENRKHLLEDIRNIGDRVERILNQIYIQNGEANINSKIKIALQNEKEKEKGANKENEKIYQTYLDSSAKMEKKK